MISKIFNDRRLIVNQSKSDGLGLSLRHRTSGTRLDRGANRLRQQPSTEKSSVTSAILWPMPAFSTPWSALKRSLTGSRVLVSRSPQRARKPKSSFGCPNRSNWEIWEFPKTLSREFSKFPRTNPLAFAGFLVNAPVNYLFSRGRFGNFRQS